MGVLKFDSNIKYSSHDYNKFWGRITTSRSTDRPTDRLTDGPTDGSTDRPTLNQSLDPLGLLASI